MEIIRYEERFKQKFIAMNKSWIQEYFTLEAHDLEQLKDIDKLMADGAMIYFAVENEEVLSTCMASPIKNETWEICKFATNKNAQGKGAGKAVFKASLDYAIENEAKKVVVYSNHSLKPALHIYHSFGFKEVPVDIDDYDRCNYQAELVVGN